MIFFPFVIAVSLIFPATLQLITPTGALAFAKIQQQQAKALSKVLQLRAKATLATARARNEINRRSATYWPKIRSRSAENEEFDEHEDFRDQNTLQDDIARNSNFDQQSFSNPPPVVHDANSKFNNDVAFLQNAPTEITNSALFEEPPNNKLPDQLLCPQYDPNLVKLPHNSEPLHEDTLSCVNKFAQNRQRSNWDQEKKTQEVLDNVWNSVPFSQSASDQNNNFFRKTEAEAIEIPMDENVPSNPNEKSANPHLKPHGFIHTHSHTHQHVHGAFPKVITQQPLLVTPTSTIGQNNFASSNFATQHSASSFSSQSSQQSGLNAFGNQQAVVFPQSAGIQQNVPNAFPNILPSSSAVNINTNQNQNFIAPTFNNQRGFGSLNQINVAQNAASQFSQQAGLSSISNQNIVAPLLPNTQTSFSNLNSLNGVQNFASSATSQQNAINAFSNQNAPTILPPAVVENFENGLSNSNAGFISSNVNKQFTQSNGCPVCQNGNSANHASHATLFTQPGLTNGQSNFNEASFVSKSQSAASASQSSSFSGQRKFIDGSQFIMPRSSANNITEEPVSSDTFKTKEHNDNENQEGQNIHTFELPPPYIPELIRFWLPDGTELIPHNKSPAEENFENPGAKSADPHLHSHSHFHSKTFTHGHGVVVPNAQVQPPVQVLQPVNVHVVQNQNGGLFSNNPYHNGFSHQRTSQIIGHGHASEPNPISSVNSITEEPVSSDTFEPKEHNDNENQESHNIHSFKLPRGDTPELITFWIPSDSEVIPHNKSSDENVENSAAKSADPHLHSHSHFHSKTFTHGHGALVQPPVQVIQPVNVHVVQNQNGGLLSNNPYHSGFSHQQALQTSQIFGHGNAVAQNQNIHGPFSISNQNQQILVDGYGNAVAQNQILGSPTPFYREGDLKDIEDSLKGEKLSENLVSQPNEKNNTETEVDNKHRETNSAETQDQSEKLRSLLDIPRHNLRRNQEWSYRKRRSDNCSAHNLDDILTSQRKMVDALKKDVKDDEDLLMIGFIGESMLNDLVQRKNLSIGHNRKKRQLHRSLPVTRLVSDPNARLDISKTLENIGTVTRHTFEDSRAPMFHVRNMLGNARNSVMAGLKIPPTNILIPTKYDIVKNDGTTDNGQEGTVRAINSKLISGDQIQNLKESRGNYEDGDNFGVLGTFQRLGNIIKNSVNSGKDSLIHANDAAHDARDIVYSARYAVPRLIIPARTVPVVTKTPKKAMLIAPRLLDISEDKVGIPLQTRPDFVSVGHVMDAVGISKPTGNKIDLQKIIIEPRNALSNIKISNLKKPKELRASAPLKEWIEENQKIARVKAIKENQNDVLAETLKNLNAAKQSVGATSLKDFLTKIREEYNTVLRSELKERKSKFKKIPPRRKGGKKFGNSHGFRQSDPSKDLGPALGSRSAIDNTETTKGLTTNKKESNLKDEQVGLLLPPALMHPFMNQASKTQIKDYLRENGDTADLVGARKKSGGQQQVNSRNHEDLSKKQAQNFRNYEDLVRQQIINSKNEQLSQKQEMAESRTQVDLEQQQMRHSRTQDLDPQHIKNSQNTDFDKEPTKQNFRNVDFGQEQVGNSRNEDLGHILGAINPVMFERYFNESLSHKNEGSSPHEKFVNKKVGRKSRSAPAAQGKQVTNQNPIESSTTHTSENDEKTGMVMKLQGAATKPFMGSASKKNIKSFLHKFNDHSSEDHPEPPQWDQLIVPADNIEEPYYDENEEY